eukprot:GFUD01041883.1.p1 GENE.GFUD01041883.1~~GFUD01041883.1.p1  ORF type:complete len:950 (+),score=279.37 GFUD01041883.1:209-3058(+)
MSPSKKQAENSERPDRGDRGGDKARNKRQQRTTGARSAMPKMNIPTRERLMSDRSEIGEDACQVCMNKMEVFSVGECNHPVCHICSTRMRVLCQRNECAICRQDLPKVIYTLAELKFEDIKDNIYPMDRKFKICFETEEIQNQYTAMLDHRCPVCKEKVLFKTFRQLDQHIRREHELYYCDLCVTNLRVFTHERKFYNRKQLVEHRRKGDPDDSSFKGHPLCEFCDQRFIDNEELYKHLRKDHYFCHFCDADGFQYFYSEYGDLSKHFDTDHFLCKEPECEEQKFVVFRTEIDIKGHRLERHSGALSKAASKETRKVDVEFSYSRREPGVRERGGREERGGRGRGRDRGHGRPQTPDQIYDQLDGPPRESQEPVPDLQADFPSLFAAAPVPLQTSKSGELAKKVAHSSGRNTQSASWNTQGPVNLKEDFPSLPGAAPAPVPSGPTPARLVNKPAKQPQKAAPASKAEQFPGLPASSKPMSAAIRPQSKPVISRPISAPVQVKSKQAEVAPKVRRAPAVDPFEDDYPAMDEPNINLSAFSRMTVKNSGQDFSYTSSETTSNIKTIDASILENRNKAAAISSNASKVNLMTDFPGLGKPEKKLDLSMSGSSKKNKNKNKKTTVNNNNYASQLKENSKPEKASLSSICDFLGGTDKKVEKKVPETKAVDKPKVKVKVVEEPKVKPIVSKVVSEEQVYRPSKEKKKENQENKTNKVNKNVAASEDFPTLGGAGKKLGANFVRADDKLIKKPEVQSQWNKNSHAKENETPDDWETIADKQRSGPPGFSKGPPGFSDQNGHKSKSKTPPGFGNKVLSENSKNLSSFKYSPPVDFQDRNVKLISTISSLIGGKSLEFGMFKDISGQFRAGKLSSKSYFSQCRELVVNTKFNKFFPELLVLLPDIKKQQELFVLYQTENPSNVSGLSECSTCSQITLIAERSRHAETHEMDSDFPQL